MGGLTPHIFSKYATTKILSLELTFSFGKQSPQKAITAAVRGPSDTFIAGTADGRVFSYQTASQSVSCVEGEAHTNLVSGLSAGSDGTLYSSGFDDRVREISANDGAFSFTYVRSSCLTMILKCMARQATFGACSQPKTLAIAGDDTLFVVEINVIEAIRSNQRVFELKPKYIPSAIAATRDIVAVGSEVSCLIEIFSQSFMPWLLLCCH